MSELQQKEPLLTEPRAPATAPSQDKGALLKYSSLGFLIVQNASHVLLLRYSRIIEGDCKEYVTSVAVLCAEVLKLVFCTLVVFGIEGGPVSLFRRLKTDIWDRKLDTLKVAVPALCFTIQNNLQFVRHGLGESHFHKIQRGALAGGG